MSDVTDIRSRQTQLSATQFLSLIDRGETDFRNFGKIVVPDDVFLGNRVIETEVDLGHIVFERGLSLGSTTFFEPFHFNHSTFKLGLYFNQAVFGGFVTAESGCFHGPVDLCKSKLKRGLSLGESTFHGYFQGSEASIGDSLKFEDSVFYDRVLCLGLKTRLLECERAHFMKSFSCGDMTVYERFDFGDASFSAEDERSLCTFDCASVRIDGDTCLGNPTFERIEASDTPYLAWVIQMYLDFNIHYKIHHAPPHLLPDWLRTGAEYSKGADP